MAAEASPKDGLRCHHCTGPLSKDMVSSVLNESDVRLFPENAGNERLELAAPDKRQLLHVMPFVHRWVKGPMSLHFLIGAPPVIVFLSVCTGLTGGAVPAIAELASSSYHAAVSSHSPSF